MAELIVTADMALVSFIMAILKEAGLLFTVDPAYGAANAGFVNYGISSYQRVMVRVEDLAEARRLVNQAMQDLPPAEDS